MASQGDGFEAFPRSYVGGAALNLVIAVLILAFAAVVEQLAANTCSPACPW